MAKTKRAAKIVVNGINLTPVFRNASVSIDRGNDAYSPRHASWALSCLDITVSSMKVASSIRTTLGSSAIRCARGYGVRL